jgi:hypothetical protein
MLWFYVCSYNFNNKWLQFIITIIVIIIASCLVLVSHKIVADATVLSKHLWQTKRH